METSLRLIQTDDFVILKKWKIRIEELENMKIDYENSLYWLVNYDKQSIGIVCLFNIDKHKKTASWNYYLEKDIRFENAGHILESNLYDYVFDVLDLKMVYSKIVCYNQQHCVERDEWNNVRLCLSYKKINYDFNLRPHHVGYAVLNLRKTLERYRKLGYYQATKIFDDIERNIQIVFLKSYEGDESIELIAPLSNECPISGILKQMKNVSSPYHICYETDEFERAITIMKKRGFVPTTAPASAVAFQHKRVIFMLNKEAGLIELVEK